MKKGDSIYQDLWDTVITDGAFSDTRTPTASYYANENNPNYFSDLFAINFNAHSYNSIYGNSTTVVPKSRKCRFYISY